MREVQKLLRLSRSTLRSLVDAGFVSPARGPRRAWRFSFQDLILLRAAQALVAARVPARRITRSIKALRRRLPAAIPLSGLSLCAIADRVVVREGDSRWQAESGQYLLGFEQDPATGTLTVIDRQAGKSAQEDPADVDVHLERGRLLHERGQLEKAEEAYRAGLEACGGDSLLLFNLGVLLDDMKRKEEAVEAYRGALRAEPSFADCHYNLALLYEELKQPQAAIRHMAQYRRLMGTRPR